jgi:hypothetical protein
MNIEFRLRCPAAPAIRATGGVFQSPINQGAQPVARNVDLSNVHTTTTPPLPNGRYVLRCKITGFSGAASFEIGAWGIKPNGDVVELTGWQVRTLPVPPKGISTIKTLAFKVP